jgi:hypothetical protein
LGTNTLTINGSLELHPNVTITAGTGVIAFAGAGTGKTITTANINIPRPITFNNATAEWILQDSLKITNNNLTLDNGTLKFNENYASCTTLTFANGTLNMSGGFLKANSFTTSGTNARNLIIAHATIDVGTWTYSNTGSVALTAAATAGSVIRANIFTGRITDNYNVIIAGTGIVQAGTFKKIIPYPNSDIARLQNVITDTLILGELILSGRY